MNYNKKIKLWCFLVFCINILKFVFSDGYSYTAINLRLADSVAERNVYCVFNNPAGLCGLKTPEIFLNYNLFYNNLTDKTKFLNNTFGFFIKDILKGGIALGYNQFGVESWYIKDKFVLSYGRDMQDITEVKELKLGVKISYERETYTLDEYMINSPVFLKGNTKDFLSLSLGLLYSLSKLDPSNNIIGIVLENVNQPDTGLLFEERLPLVLTLSYKYCYSNFSFYPTVKFEFSSKNDYTLNLASEYNIVIKQKTKISPSLAMGFGSRNYLRFIAGFQIKTPQIEVNYGYGLDVGDKPSTGGQHSLSLAFKFLSEAVVEEKVSKEEYLKLLKEKEELQKQLETTKKIIEVQKIEEKPTIISTPTITTEEVLLKKLEEIEKKLKEVESKKIEEKPKVSPPVVTTTPPPVRKRYHTVVSGDTLPKLAEKYYGDPNQWRKIYEANKEKIIRGQLIPGTVLEIP